MLQSWALSLFCLLGASQSLKIASEANRRKLLTSAFVKHKPC